MKFSYIVKWTGIVLMGVALSQQGFSKGKVYTWTDAKGTVHFGERPPKNVKAIVVKTRTGHSDPTPAQTTPAQTAAAQPKPAAETARTGQQASLKNPAHCAQAKENLTTLNSFARVRMPNADGTHVYLSEEDKVKQREISQQIIDQACE